MADEPSLDQIRAERPPGGGEESLTEVFAHYGHLLQKYYWLIILAGVLSAGAAYLWTQQQPKIYRAESKLIFHKSSGSIFGEKIEQVDLLDPGGRWAFDQFWNSQKQVFRTRSFIERVVERKGLLNEPRLLPDRPEGAEPLSEKEKLDAVIGKVLGVSKVELVEESRVATIQVEMEHPELASEIANGMAEAYIAYTEEFQSGGLKQISSWFDSYVASKRKELEQAQSKLQDFKKKNNILSFSYEDRQNLTSANMETINSELLQVRRELSSERALLKQINSIKEGEGDLTALTEMVENETLESSLERKARLEEELAELKARYLSEHPKVQAREQKLEAVKQNIDAEIDKVVGGIENRVERLEREKQNLQSELSRLKSEIFELNELGVQYRQLKNQKDNLQELYDTVLQRSSELDINSLYQSDKIQILERAEVPEFPISPVLPLNLAIGAALGLALGTGLTFLLDALDTTIKSEEDVAQYTDKPILALLPELNDDVLGGLERIGESPADTVVHTAPKSTFAEGIKTLRTNLTFMAPDDPPRSILITSAGPQEGKTLASTNTAIAMAQSGLKTVIVDTDLRRPRIHRALDLDKSPGLTESIRGTASDEEIVQSTFDDNLYAVTSGEVPPNPSELLHSDSFGELSERLREDFDRVIYDSPPLAAVSDALIVSQLVDGVILMTEFATTKQETLERSLKQLHEIGAPLLGCVINEISTEGMGYNYEYYRYSYYGSDEEESDQKLAS